MMTTGTIEETIYQRQLLKEELCNVIADIDNDGSSSSSASSSKKASSSSKRQFSLEEVSTHFEICFSITCTKFFVCIACLYRGALSMTMNLYYIW
jgi:hypothetical protein